MVSLSRPLANFGNPWARKPRGNQIVMPKCEDRKYSKYILMMGNIGSIANFDVKIGNIRNIFYLMGYSELKLTFTLDEWAVVAEK